MKLKLLSILMLLLVTSSSYASFSCGVTSTGSKNCTYVGKVRLVYVNQQGLVLIYPAETIDINLAKNIGFSGVSTGAAFAVGKIYEETNKLGMEFTKSAMALITSAKVADRNITLAFTDRGGDPATYRFSGYLKLDRMTLQ